MASCGETYVRRDCDSFRTSSTTVCTPTASKSLPSCTAIDPLPLGNLAHDGVRGAESRVEPMKYFIILEPTPTGFSAYSPDVDGCVAAGDSREETIVLMREAIEFHLE